VSAAPFQAPDGITPIRAIRAWGYAFDGALGRLHPIGRMESGGPSPWDDAGGSRWLRASCGGRLRLGPHLDPHLEVPSYDCICGFYAVKRLAKLLEMLTPVKGPIVIGTVQLAGTVIEHDFGYRAELARVVELIPRLGQETTVRQLAMCLGVAVGPPIVHWPPSDSDPSRPRLPMASWVREPAVEDRARAAAHVAA
jgi:hypothetical protein